MFQSNTYETINIDFKILEMCTSFLEEERRKKRTKPETKNKYIFWVCADATEFCSKSL